MNVDFMRLVDKWAGVPVCFLLSLIDVALRPFKRKSRPERIERILFVQLSDTGAGISANSAVRKAQAFFPEAELYYVVFEEMQESIRLLGIIPESNIFTVPSDRLGRFVSGSVRLIPAIRKLKVDVVIDMEFFSRAGMLYSYLFGAPVRAGFYRYHMEGLYRGSLLTHKVIYNHTKHIAFNFLALVYSLRENPQEPLTKVPQYSEDIVVPGITPALEDRQRIFQKLQQRCPEVYLDKKIVLLNPNGSGRVPLRRWPVTRYVELAKRLLANPKTIVVITGVASEKDDAAEICEAVRHARCIDFAGETTVRELIDLFSVSCVLVSNDSGPPNFASLTDMPVIMLFGPEAPQSCLPLGKNIHALYANLLCSPCLSAYNHRKSACTDNKCLQAISVDDVCEQIDAVVSGLLQQV